MLPSRQWVLSWWKRENASYNTGEKRVQRNERLQISNCAAKRRASSMSEHRERMTNALKTRFVPALRQRGFVGSLPHFRRRLPDRVDYLMVQFYSAGGSFVVEVGRTGPDGFTDGPWKQLPVDKINVGHIFSDRRRLTPRDAHGGWRGGNWFEFGPRNYNPPQPEKPQEFYDAIADQALAVFTTTGEPWLARPEPPDSGAPRAKPDGPPPWPMGDGPFARFATLFPWNQPNMRIACLLAGPEPPLYRWETWRKIVAPMTELAELLPRATSIRSFQNRPGESKWLPFGRLHWSEDSNRKWSNEYLEAPEPVEFEATEIWSPSRSTWAEEGKNPELYAKIDQSILGQTQGFILALRRDVLKSVRGSAEAADQVIDAVLAALPGAHRIVFDRAWNEKRLFGVIAQNPLDYTASSEVMVWAKAHSWAHVASFAAK
jgi:hypothetical protein